MPLNSQQLAAGHSLPGKPSTFLLPPPPIPTSLSLPRLPCCICFSAYCPHLELRFQRGCWAGNKELSNYSAALRQSVNCCCLLAVLPSSMCCLSAGAPQSTAVGEAAPSARCRSWLPPHLAPGVDRKTWAAAVRWIGSTPPWHICKYGGSSAVSWEEDVDSLSWELCACWTPLLSGQHATDLLGAIRERDDSNATWLTACYFVLAKWSSLHLSSSASVGPLVWGNQGTWQMSQAEGEAVSNLPSQQDNVSPPAAGVPGFTVLSWTKHWHGLDKDKHHILLLLLYEVTCMGWTQLSTHCTEAVIPVAWQPVPQDAHDRAN